MIRTILLMFIALLIVSSAAAQGRSEHDLKQEMRNLRVDQFSIAYNQDANESKIMAVAKNFDQKEASKAGVQAMNFAASFNFAFWVLTKKPRFAVDHHWSGTADDKTFDLGDARYVSKPDENIEYLNFVLTREDLKKISAPGAKFTVGGYQFTVTPAQTKMLSDLYTLSTP